MRWLSGLGVAVAVSACGLYDPGQGVSPASAAAGSAGSPSPQTSPSTRGAAGGTNARLRNPEREGPAGPTLGTASGGASAAGSGSETPSLVESGGQSVAAQGAAGNASADDPTPVPSVAGAAGVNGSCSAPTCGAAVLHSSHALHFEGLATYAQILLPFSDSQAHGGWGTGNTFEAWFRTTSAVAPLLSADDNTNWGSIGVDVVKGGLCFHITIGTSGGESEICTASHTLNDGAWHHAALIVTSSRLVFFEDGLVARDAPQNPPLVLPAHLDVVYLGRGPEGPRGDTYFLPGDLDEVRIWYGSRTPSEVRDYRATELTSAPDPEDAGPYLLGYFRLDESGDEKTLTDSNAAYHVVTWDPSLPRPMPPSHQGQLNVHETDPPWITPGAF